MTDTPRTIPTHNEHGRAICGEPYPPEVVSAKLARGSVGDYAYFCRMIVPRPGDKCFRHSTGPHRVSKAGTQSWLLAAAKAFDEMSGDSLEELINAAKAYQAARAYP